jgi:hypothetical protein
MLYGYFVPLTGIDGTLVCKNFYQYTAKIMHFNFTAYFSKNFIAEEGV